LREHHDEIRTRGATVAAVGTGDAGYARRFVEDERIPYLVLVDDDGRAAEAAAVPTASWFRLLHPSTWRATRETYQRGHRVHATGKRVTQLGATFVVGPGERVRYTHVDADSTDHAPLAEVLGALGSTATPRPLARRARRASGTLWAGSTASENTFTMRSSSPTSRMVPCRHASTTGLRRVIIRPILMIPSAAPRPAAA
jgi:peroxiredoxin